MLHIKSQIRLRKKSSYHKQCDYNKPFDKDVNDVSFHYEKNKCIDMLDSKEHHYIYQIEHEDKGKYEQRGSEHLRVARSITYMDDSH